MTFQASHRRISAAYHRAKHLSIDNRSKLVLMSDIHRGCGTGADAFAKNQTLYYTALRHYDREGYTYLELGDGDDLWQERRMGEIKAEYEHVFSLLAKLYQEGRFHMIYGNHDRVKRSAGWVRANLYSYILRADGVPQPLFPGIVVAEAVLLKHQQAGLVFLLLHGHQADFFNDRLWWLARFLVRYLWKPLELVGFRNPFDAGKNPRRRTKVEQTLAGWAEKEGITLIAGHTHRPTLPKRAEGRYINTGSAVHSRYITALEIENGALRLVKWEMAAEENGMLYITKAPQF